jgi:hypothetical protein
VEQVLVVKVLQGVVVHLVVLVVVTHTPLVVEEELVQLVRPLLRALVEDVGEMVEQVVPLALLVQVFFTLAEEEVVIEALQLVGLVLVGQV